MFDVNLAAMKLKVCVILAFSLATSQVAAQSFLKKLGKSIEKTVGRTIEKTVEKEVGELFDNQNGNASSFSSQQQNTPTEQPQVSTAPTQRVSGIRTAVLSDSGENIPREPGLDYIDEYGINHGGGILVGGILWAPVNCGYHATDYPYGKLYQWGRRHGQGYGEPYMNKETGNVNPDKTTANVVRAGRWVTPAEARQHPNNFYARGDGAALFNWTVNNTKLWNTFTDDGIISKSEDDPCPKGWRLPDLQDFYVLVKHYSEVSEYPAGGPKGRWFSGPEEYGCNVPRIFLPLTGVRSLAGECGARDSFVRYWSGRHGGGEGLVWHLFFSTDDNRVEVNPVAYPHEGFAVRCVKEIEGQRRH